MFTTANVSHYTVAGFSCSINNCEVFLYNQLTCLCKHRNENNHLATNNHCALSITLMHPCPIVMQVYLPYN